MRLYQSGDRSAGICETCKSRVNTHMEYRDYTPTGWHETVPDVLVAVCEVCGQVVGVPHQSTPKINEHRRHKKVDQVPIEARIPRVLDEAVDLVTATLGGDRRMIRPAIFRYYINLLTDNPLLVEAVKDNAAKPISTDQAEGRVSVKVLSRQWHPAWAAAKRGGIQSKADLVRGIIVLAARDFQISFAADDLSDAKAKRLKGAQARREALVTFAKTLL